MAVRVSIDMGTVRDILAKMYAGESLPAVRQPADIWNVLTASLIFIGDHNKPSDCVIKWDSVEGVDDLNDAYRDILSALQFTNRRALGVAFGEVESASSERVTVDVSTNADKTMCVVPVEDGPSTDRERRFHC